MVKANRNFRSALQRRAGKVQSATGAASKRSREVRRAEELHARMRAVSAYEQAHKIGGIWYLVELRHHPFLLGGAFPGRTGRRDEAMAGEDREPVFDVVLGHSVNAADRFDLEQVYGRRGVYGVRKRELSYRELRELGLLHEVKG
jgi:hypothetical protein